MHSNVDYETNSQPRFSGTGQSNLPQKVDYRRQKTGKGPTKPFWRRKKPQFRGDNPNLQQGSMDRRENKISNNMVNGIPPIHEQREPGLLPIQPEELRITTRIDSDNKLIGQFWFSRSGPQIICGILSNLFKDIQSSSADLRNNQFNPDFGYAYTYICISYQLLNTLHLTGIDTHYETLRSAFSSSFLVPEFLQEFTRLFGNIKTEEGNYQMRGIAGTIITYMQTAYDMIVSRISDGTDPENHRYSQLKTCAEMASLNTLVFNSPNFRDNLIGSAIQNNTELCFSHLKIKFTDGSVHKTEVNIFECGSKKLYALGYACQDSSTSKKLIALSKLIDVDKTYDQIFDGSYSSECTLLSLQPAKRFTLSRFKEMFSHALGILSTKCYHVIHNRIEMKPLYANKTGSLSQLIWRHALSPNLCSASYHLLSEHKAYCGHHLFLDTIVFYGPRVVNTSDYDKTSNLLLLWQKRIKANNFH